MKVPSPIEHGFNPTTKDWESVEGKEKYRKSVTEYAKYISANQNRIKITHGYATVSKECSKDTIDALNELSKIAYKKNKIIVMILTGKCEEDFDKWIGIEYEGFECMESTHIDDFPYAIKNVLIIEFFDSVGIYIDCPPIDDNTYTKIIFGCLVNSDMLYNKETNHKGFDTRQGATTKAIQKANEIYNEKHK